MYAPLRHLAARFAGFDHWPQLADYQAMLDERAEPIRTLAGKALTVVAQDDTPDRFEDHYAPRIYRSGELQTRRHNWHDFFQFLSWLMFPATKAAINAAHLPQARRRLELRGERGRRSPLENMLSLFDEGGAVIVSADARLLQMIREFRWHELFWRCRDELGGKLACISFGHALYEKGLAPYLGMTANTLLIETDASFFDRTNSEQLAWLDQKLAALFCAGEVLTQPKDLHPFPILGMPGWDKDNGCERYYRNTHYFRPGRRGQIKSRKGGEG